MTTQQLIQAINDGTVPKAGILRREGPAKDCVVTTTVDGQTIEVPDITRNEPGTDQSAETV